MSRATQDVRIEAAILTDEQARMQFGVDLASRGIQANWLSVTNSGVAGLWFLATAFDADYYAPNEAARLFFGELGSADEARLARHFHEQAIPFRVPAGETVTGYVLTPRYEGGRFANFELVGRGRRVHLGFALPIAGQVLDFADLDEAALYAPSARRALDAEGLRRSLRELPCCATDEAGEGLGDPLNVVLVGHRSEVLGALARGGWAFTHAINLRSIGRMVGAAISGTPYPVAPVSPLYLFGRAQDFALQRARRGIAQRNHMRLWLSPWDFEGRPVWVGQVSRDIGVKLTTRTPSLTTHVIDRQVDETREYVLQSLLVNRTVDRFGFVAAADGGAAAAPRTNLTGDPYETDGLRLVVVLAEEPVPPHEARNLHWQEDVDPMR
ncbi:MAG: LssY C-terminal domain-containing protein [Gammaproteobacteria bacterium]